MSIIRQYPYSRDHYDYLESNQLFGMEELLLL